MFWGILIAITSFGQFLLLQLEFYTQSWYPYLALPLGGLASYWYYYKKHKQTIASTHLDKIMSRIWIVLSIFMITLSFAFGGILKTHLIPLMIVFLAIGILISGAILGSQIFSYSGILITAIAFACFFIDWAYRPLFQGIAALLGVFFPGMLLHFKNTKKKDV